MEGYLMMSGKERRRLKVMERVAAEEITLKEAEHLLGISYRQARRIYRRYVGEGDGGLIHKSRGKPSNRRFDEVFHQEALALHQSRYHDFGPTFAAEKLASEGYVLDHETLRRWLKNEGLYQARRKRSKHRQWRERKAHFGELVQFDGSHHQWFEERGEKCCLMNMVDDATGTTMAAFDDEETTAAAMTLLWQWIEKHGIPQALYTDRKNVYVSEREPTIEEQLQGEEPLTQFGRACKKLGIRIILARSPQAKGRVERKNGVYQDRLVKELRLEGINAIAEANDFLRKGYLDKLNAKFAVCAREKADYHRQAETEIDLRSVFCMEEKRSISNDWTVRYKVRYFQILKQENLPPAKAKVVVQEYLDGSIHIVYRDKELVAAELDSRPEKADEPLVKKVKIKYVPPMNHPWRQGYLRAE